MSALPGYDEWLTTPPWDRHRDPICECGHEADDHNDERVENYGLLVDLYNRLSLYFSECGELYSGPALTTEQILYSVKAMIASCQCKGCHCREYTPCGRDDGDDVEFEEAV